MRSRLATLCAAGVALVAAGCGDDDTAADPATTTTATTVQATTAAPSAVSTGPGGEHLPPAPDAGTFEAGDAGTVEVRRFGDRLQAGQVDQADGWSYEVTEMSGDRVEVRFDKGGDEVILRVRIEDGEMTSEVDGG